MTFQCPRCAANSDRCRKEYKGLHGEEVGGKGHRLIIDATSYMPPDTISVNNNLVESPTGDVINELERMINDLRKK